jgi:mannose-6-phosphate isomerase
MFLLKGKVQHYAWGGKGYIPELLSISNDENRPFAEYWLGIHPGAPATVELSANAQTGLLDLIRSEPRRYLGTRVASRFQDLPFLLKILDVKDMLSIQVHPSKEEAIKGFDRENAMGIPQDAPNRNYRDNNHKPEMMLALGDFWLLHGFRPEQDLARVLENVEQLSALLPVFESSGYKGLYQYVMELPQEGVNKMLQPLAEEILPKYAAGELSKSDPHFWAARAMVTYPDAFDRGIFSVYFFNLVQLKAGEAIFQGAGLPHAYLEGQNVELMSNSDNVLRGGLTPKFVDVPELMKHIRFEAIVPQPMDSGSKEHEQLFNCPVDDFSLVAATVQQSGYTFTTTGPEIMLVLDGQGEAKVGGAGWRLEKGASFFILAGVGVRVEGVGVRLVRAFVP